MTKRKHEEALFINIPHRKPRPNKLHYMDASYLPYHHYSYSIMSTMVSQITGVSIVYWTICSGPDQGNHQSYASLGFIKEIHRWSVNSPHKGPVTRKNVSIWWRHHDSWRGYDNIVQIKQWCQFIYAKPIVAQHCYMIELIFDTIHSANSLAPGYCLNRCWRIVKLDYRNSSQWNLNQNINLFLSIKQNAFKILGILFKTWFVKMCLMVLFKTVLLRVVSLTFLVKWMIHHLLWSIGTCKWYSSGIWKVVVIW